MAAMFLIPGWLKISYGTEAPEWFRNLDFPWPQSWLSADLNWFMAGWGEVIFGLLLLTPLAGWAALGLIYICFVAVYTSHFDMGWAGWNDPEDGFKIPLMYGLMLFAIFGERFAACNRQFAKLLRNRGE